MIKPSSILLALVLSIGAVRAADFITTLELSTYDGSRMTVIDAESSANVVAQGLAVDDGGKIYMSDRGATDKENGRILLLQGTNEALTIVSGLRQPADIEMRPDQRGLVIALAGGAIQTRFFGVSIKVLPGPNTPALPRLYLKTDEGPVAGSLGGDGWYHFNHVLNPLQTNVTATLILNNGNPPQARNIDLRDPVTGKITGHVVKEVSF
ncbi:MAG: hypothetical protein H7A43_03920 [Verrucomicrobia bacterium]|nr:hypothetical protein [Kiritimatiellia bacterium]MCP5487775.1 hypothetical protein [Verrucomicrobiota bacterium]